MPFWNRKKAQATEPAGVRAFPPETQAEPKAHTVQQVRMVRAGFDSAQTTDNNADHWSWADGLSADAAASPMVRKIICRRVRYEIKNNCYARGIWSTMVNDCVGSGPTLQVTTSSDETNTLITRTVSDWAKEIGMADLLRTLCGSEIESGEVLCVMQSNPAMKSPIKITFKAVECDRLTAPYLSPNVDNDLHCDGIDYDEFENPTNYNILKRHPGDVYNMTSNPLDATAVPAKFVYHLFKKQRPGQRRGVSEFSPALPLFSQMRRLTLATVTAAESIADVAIAVTTEVPAGGGGSGVSSDIAGEGEVAGSAGGFQVGEQFQLERGMSTVLAPGQKIMQPTPEQPSQAYPAFIDALIREVGRCVDVPFGIAAMDDSKANMSSAYLTRQGYSHAQEVRRSRIDALIEWMIDLALDYASALPQFDGLADIDFPGNHHWLWPSLGHHADPAKTANGQQTRLKIGATDLATECARDGREISKVLANQAKALGVTVPQLQAMLITNLYPPPLGVPEAGTPRPNPSDESPAPEKDDADVPTDAD